MSKQSERVFSSTFKEAAVAEMEAGRKVAPLARELGVARQVLYRWRAAWRAEGIAGLSKRPGRKPGRVGEAARARAQAGAEPLGDGPPDKAVLPADDALAQAMAQMAELERIIGRQQVDLDFFQRALRPFVADTTARPAPSAATSTRSSRK